VLFAEGGMLGLEVSESVLKGFHGVEVGLADLRGFHIVLLG
jgi:hypothetical protein